MRAIVLFLISVIILLSCDDIPTTHSGNKYLGTWVFDSADSNITHLIRSTEFDNDKYGFSILEDNIFVERKNAGWCGTPPISYQNYTGEWKDKNETTLIIKVGYWGGITKYDLEIVSKTDGTLSVKYIYDN